MRQLSLESSTRRYSPCLHHPVFTLFYTCRRAMRAWRRDWSAPPCPPTGPAPYSSMKQSKLTRFSKNTLINAQMLMQKSQLQRFDKTDNFHICKQSSLNHLLWLPTCHLVALSVPRNSRIKVQTTKLYHQPKDVNGKLRLNPKSLTGG